MDLLFQFFSVKIDGRDISSFALGGIVEISVGNCQMMTDARLRDTVAAGLDGDFILCVSEITCQTCIVTGKNKRCTGFGKKCRKIFFAGGFIEFDCTGKCQSFGRNIAF